MELFTKKIQEIVNNQISMDIQFIYPNDQNNIE